MTHPFQPEKAIREAREREHREHSPDPGLLIDILGETGAKLSLILESLAVLHEKVDRLSQNQEHLEQAVSDLGTALDGLAADFAAEVQALKDAQAGGQPLDFTSVDAVVARAQQMASDNAPAAAPVDPANPGDGTDSAPGTGADVPPAS